MKKFYITKHYTIAQILQTLGGSQKPHKRRENVFQV
uniref:Uncharacterized protein n=1 Tax=Anguilla anguilla TaxID=7936 RepID=A0A0E9V8W5_ANGAN